jgi:CRISPR-associated endonuclease/helicase Cas3
MNLPGDIRELIERVYNDEHDGSVPEGLRESMDEAYAERMTKRSIADYNKIDLDAGYCDENQGWTDDEDCRTRLGEPTIVLRLARWHEGRLTPWSIDEDHPWRMSEVRVRKQQVAAAAKPKDRALRKAIKETKESWRCKGKWQVLIPMTTVDGDIWIGNALDYSGREVTLRYTPTRGLEVL